MEKKLAFNEEGVEVTELDGSNLERHLKVRISSERMNQKIDKELDLKVDSIKLDGFRSGSAVKKSSSGYSTKKKMIFSKYGAAITSEVVEREVNAVIESIIKEEKKEVISGPKIENFNKDELGNIEFDLSFELVPDFELPDLSKIKLEIPEVIISEEEIKDRFNKMTERFSKEYTLKNTEALTSDKVLIDFVGTVEGKEFEGGSAKDFELILGQGVLIPGFEEKLIGSKAGDNVKVDVIFPENYHVKELADKPACFNVDVKSVFSAQDVEVTDELLKKEGYDSFEALNKNIRNFLERTYKKQTRSVIKLRFFEILEGILDFALPPVMLKKEYELLEKQVENAEEKTKKAPEEIKKYLERISTRRLKIGFFLSKYAKLNSLSVTTEELKEAVMDKVYEQPNLADQIFKFYSSNPEAMRDLAGPVLENKAVDHIIDNSIEIVKKPCTPSELELLMKQETQNILF